MKCQVVTSESSRKLIEERLSDPDAVHVFKRQPRTPEEQEEIDAMEERKAIEGFQAMAHTGTVPVQQMTAQEWEEHKRKRAEEWRKKESCQTKSQP